VLLVFQPGEESPGGARYLCESGLFTAFHVAAIFGLHLWPGLEQGQVFSRENELMSRSCEVNADFFGRSAHIAKASEGIDALAACMEFYHRATAMEQALPPDIFRLLKFGRMEAGTVRNAIASNAHLEGSLRAFQDPVFEGLRECLYKIAKDVERESGCRIELSMSQGYPAVMNPPDLYRRVKAMVPFRDLEEPSMTSEDFSWYQKHIPGVFFFLGLGDTPALHSRDFAFNESVLVNGADFFEQLAENYR
jgi:hippurate hydrolase